MRNAASPSRGTWAAYVAAVRKGTGLDKTAFGAAIGKDRATISRWESGEFGTRDTAVLKRFAEAFSLDLAEVLAAAGLRPDLQAPTAPSNPPMPREVRHALALIADPKTSPEERRYLIAILIGAADTVIKVSGRGDEPER